ncbi:unnamed protein product [Parnassius apollo]|uniref:(apollo) hypothetical protein n=1 Tax=Parnassius apollo TaxID=110799 RepID=A0A8S3XXR2_PARAO|nr:unnamed protein product [Parnassius apollo]
MQLILIILQNAVSQYSTLLNYYNNYLEQRYYRQHQNEYYDWPKERVRRFNRHRKKNYYRSEEDSRDVNYDTYRNYYDCKCSCDRCANPKPCCTEMCASCPSQTDVIYVPYPVPLVVTVTNSPSTPPSTIAVSGTNSTKAPSITLATSNSTGDYTERTKPSDKTQTQSPSTQPPTPHLRYNKLKYCPPMANCRDDKNQEYTQKTYHRLLEDKNKSPYNTDFAKSEGHTRRDWLPRYGIVPIPDHLAIKFMSELRNYK